MKNKDQESRQAASIFELFVEVSITHTLSSTAFVQVLPHGMTLPQFKLLTHFSRTGNAGASIVDLARIFQVTKPSMGETVDKLREKSFVRVVPNPEDQREKRVSMTPKGDAARQDAVRAFAPLMEKMIAEIGVAQFEEALHALKPIRLWLDALRGNS